MHSPTTRSANDPTKQRQQIHYNFIRRKAGSPGRTSLGILLTALLLTSTLFAQLKGNGCPTPGFSPVVTYASGGSTAYSVAAGDFNGDGKTDLAVTNYNSNRVGVLRNNGNGTFVAAVTYLSGGNKPYAVTAADFNGDGKTDLAVTNYNSNSVGVLINNGNGTFAAAVSYASGGDSPGSVAAGDFNGDGKADLAVTNYYSANISVLLNKGNGVFNPAVAYGSGGSNPNSVAAGDLSGDGKADIAVANYSSGKIGVLINKGSGAFAVAVPYSSGQADPIAVTIGDFSGDGKADLAAAHYISSTIGVLNNNGNGTFGAALSYASGGNGPYSVTTGDFNGDGKTDLAAANYSSKTAGVLQNNGNGTFAAAAAFPSGGTNAYAIAAADFNSDGATDLAVANHTSSTAGVLLNTCRPCPRIIVSIPDAQALPYGVQSNTVYPGYAPASSITLNANVSGGTGPYTFTWSTGSHASSIAVSPAVATTYTVEVTDAARCASNKTSKTIQVINVYSSRNEVLICHKSGKINQTLSVAVDKVPDHLKHGDLLGSCSKDNYLNTVEEVSTAQASGARSVPEETTGAQLFVKASPNPSSQYFVLNLKTEDLSQKIYLRVVDFSGRLVEQKNNLTGNQTLRIGAFYPTGIYFAEVLQGKQKTVVKLVKKD